MAARHRCHLPVNGQSGSGGSTSLSGPIGRIDGPGATADADPAAAPSAGPKQSTIASATDTPPATARNGTERI